MGAVKRHLEGLTEELLESVRSTESALLVARRPITERGAHSATLRAVLDLGAVWLCVPDTTELDRLDAELARWNTAPPPDLALDWLDALDDAADRTLEVLEEWLEPWGLALQWTDAGLIAHRLEEL